VRCYNIVAWAEKSYMSGISKSAAPTQKQTFGIVMFSRGLTVHS